MQGKLSLPRTISLQCEYWGKFSTRGTKSDQSGGRPQICRVCNLQRTNDSFLVWEGLTNLDLPWGMWGVGFTWTTSQPPPLIFNASDLPWKICSKARGSLSMCRGKYNRDATWAVCTGKGLMFSAFHSPSPSGRNNSPQSQRLPAVTKTFPSLAAAAEGRLKSLISALSW